MLAHARTAAGALDLADLAAAGWNTAPEVLLPLAIAAALYAAGWWRLARRRPGTREPARDAAAAVAFLAIVAALVWPLDALAGRLFAAHMTQHLLLMAVAAPLVLLADPFPLMVWGLPRRLRGTVGWLLGGGGVLRSMIARLVSVPVAGLAYACILWLWHHPAAYDAALAHRWLHHVEHLAFFGAAVLFWWPVVAPAPRVRRPPAHGLRIAHVLVAALHGSLLALILTFSPEALYESYRAAGPGPALEDQARGGILMWAAGGAVDMAAVLALVWRLLLAQEPRPPAVGVTRSTAA
jgi:cytochrome c oxidase assembly factor CtaG